MLIGMVAFAGAGATLTLAIAVFVALTRAIKDKVGFWPDVLGPFTRVFTSCAVAALVAAALTAAWMNTAERHTVMATRTAASTPDGSATCRFTWPTSTAAHEQATSCPGSGSGVSTVYPTPVTAARVPLTDTVYLPDGLDPFTIVLLVAAGACAVSAGIGVAFNARPDRRRQMTEQRRLLASWQAGGPRPAPTPMPAPTPGVTRDDLTWQQIAAASERPDVQGGPLEQAPFVSRSADAPTMGEPSLPEGYPLPYVRLMTRPAGAPHRSALLLFVPDGAWWAEADGQPAREGDAVVEHNPGSGRDLAVVVGEYTVDLSDEPVFLPQRALDALRPQASRWVTTPSSGPGIPSPAPVVNRREDVR